jgi:ubiquinone/menaquinone biosynthesis C-methylase UbiE
MRAGGIDIVFSGSIAELYDALLVPLIFEPYADDLARRVAALRPRRVLETAAGTGVATRAMAKVLPHDTELIATDLNPPMLQCAQAAGAARPVQWLPADALQLPFEDGSFDVVVCQFGAMFFPDKVRAFAEARRVLRDGGTLMFSVWDRIEHNEFALCVTETLATLFPDDPPRFMVRTPHGYFDTSLILADLADAGFFTPPQLDTVTKRSVAASGAVPAAAYCQGTPLRSEIEARGGHVAVATEVCAAAVAKRFGGAPVDAMIQAHIVAVMR